MVSNQFFFSVCIPVYKNISFVERLLQSIRIQTFSDYEIVISDDSPDNLVEQFIKENFADLPLAYYCNTKALGTPANWNQAISKAKGVWIKLIHDDDWFASKDALLEMYNLLKNSECKFAYCNYENRYVEDIGKGFGKLSVWGIRKSFMLSNPVSLYGRNIIGPPSVVCVHHSIQEKYDERLKWLVDIDYYIRVLKCTSPLYIEKILVFVGVGEEQVTQYTHNVPEVEIPEGLLMLSKVGIKSFTNIYYYDAWWRLIRNLGIRSLNDFQKYVPDQIVPPPIQAIITHQSFIEVALLKKGPFSKVTMAISWLLQRIKRNF